MNPIEQLLKETADFFEQQLVDRDLRQALTILLDSGQKPQIVRQLPVVYGRTDLLLVVGRAADE
jgi:hypothetical protein